MWEMLLLSLETLVPTRARLTPRERQVLTFILMRKPGTDCFHGTPGMALRKSLSITQYNLSMLRQRLIVKGWVTESDMLEKFLSGIHRSMYESEPQVSSIEVSLKIQMDGT
jgi:DNA-binding MarR family transcriptional regulator